MNIFKKLPTTEVLIIATTVVGCIHHCDHVLRFDHSGWPFKEEVTIFTYSLFVYPAMLAVYLAKKQLVFRFVTTLLVFVSVQSAHIFIETPMNQYNTWAHGVGSGGMPNLLGIESAFLGWGAVIISILLSLLLIATILTMGRDIRSLKMR